MCQSQGLEFTMGIEYMLNFVWITICLNYITRILWHFLKWFGYETKMTKKTKISNMCGYVFG